MPPEYSFSNKLRSVKPYFHSYETNVKTRFLGRTLVEVYTEDLHYSSASTAAQILKGNLYVITNHSRNEPLCKLSDLESLLNWKLGRHDLICSLTHIHEPVVVDDNITTVYEDSELLVVNKPSGLPTHPSGSFRYNSLTSILEYERKEKLFPCHRLDKATLGILILAKSKEAASKFLKVNSYQKEYLARVEGEFPDGGPWEVDSPVFSINAAGGYFGQANITNLPLHSVTHFKRVLYNSELNQSIVSCFPKTGRMHQIRIHLRNMGYPIVNDSYYNIERNTSAANSMCSRLELEIYKKLSSKYPHINQFKQANLEMNSIDNAATVDIIASTGFGTDMGLVLKMEQLQRVKRQELTAIKENNHGIVCEKCNQQIIDTSKRSSDLSIWLHSLKYQMDGYDAFETEYPEWSFI